jgi:hypothetical protein
MSPDLVADMTFEAIINDTFYVFTEMGMKEGIENRNKLMMSGFDALEQFLAKNNPNT